MDGIKPKQHHQLIGIFSSYESANGIKAEETGDVKNKGSDNAFQTVAGSYSYTSPEGEVIQVREFERDKLSSFKFKVFSTDLLHS